jgi:ribosomal protein L33
VEACNDLQALTSRIRTEKGLLKRRFPLAAPSDLLETQKRRKLGSTGDATASLSDVKEERLSHNREAFFDRLRSFSLDFTLRLRPVSALECAMHGFRDSGRVAENHVSRLVCNQCKGENYIIDLSSKDPKRCKSFKICIFYRYSLSHFLLF